MIDNFDNFRGRNIKFLLYPDDRTHVAALDYIKSNFRYIGILHDKDIDNNGELKKPHWHILCCFPNDRWRSKLSKDLGISSNYMRKCEDKNHFSRYLLHLDDTDKFQYDESELFGNILDKFDFTPGGTSEDFKMISMIDLLDENSTSSNFNYVAAVRLICKNGMYSTLRRSGSIGSGIINYYVSVNQSLKERR